MKTFLLATEPIASRGPSEQATKRLGGTLVYAKSQDALGQDLARATEAIEQICARHLTIARNVLGKALREELGLKVMEKRLFSALLGYALRIGVIDTLICASKNDATYRVFYQSSKRANLLAAIEYAKGRVLSAQRIEVQELEKHLFGERRYNTWSSSSHVIGRLSYLGIAEFIDDFSAELVSIPNGK